MTNSDIMRHKDRELSENEQIDIRALKDKGLDFCEALEVIAIESFNSRELSLAKTKIEEAVMWATKHITR